MKEKILYISDRPSMGADMLLRNLGIDYEVLWVHSGDEVKHVPEIIFVNLSGLEDLERIKTFTGSKIFLLGSQSDLTKTAVTDIANAEKFVKPFNANEIRDKLHGISEQKAERIEKTLLLVDDDAVMIRTLREGLSTSYKVLPANSGANALKILAKTKPDLILLDYEMPDMNGTQVFEALKANPETADIPVMFLTAKSDSGSIERIESLKPEGHMLKTLPLREIKAIIQEFFGGK